MKGFTLFRIAGAATFYVLAVVLPFASSALANHADPIAQADRALVQAFEQKEKSTLNELLDPEIIWIDSNGAGSRATSNCKTCPR